MLLEGPTTGKGMVATMKQRRNQSPSDGMASLQESTKEQRKFRRGRDDLGIA